MPEAVRSIDRKTLTGQLVVNLRAEGAPVRLEKVVCTALRGLVKPESGIRLTGLTLDAFCPGQPEPTHRMAAVLAG